MQEVISDLKSCIHNFSSYDNILSKDEEVISLKKQLLSLFIGKDTSNCAEESDCVISDDPFPNTFGVDTTELVVNEEAQKPKDYVCIDNDVTKVVSDVLENIQSDVVSPNTGCFGGIDSSAKGFNEHENIDKDVPYVQPSFDSVKSFHFEGSDTKMDDNVEEMVCRNNVEKDDNSKLADAELIAEGNVAVHDDLGTGYEKDNCIEFQVSDLSEKELIHNSNNNVDLTENEVVDEPCATEPKTQVSKSQDFTAFSKSCTSVSEEKVVDDKDCSVASESYLITDTVDVSVSNQLEMGLEGNDSYVAAEPAGDELTNQVLDAATPNKCTIEFSDSFSKIQVVTALCESDASTDGCTLSKQVEKDEKINEANDNKRKAAEKDDDMDYEHHNKENPIDNVLEPIRPIQDDFCHTLLSEDDNLKTDDAELNASTNVGYFNFIKLKFY